MQYIKVIEQLGYSHKEAKIYLTSLKLGEGHVSDIAKAAKIPRSTTQQILLKLKENNLVDFYTMRRYKYWVALKPNKLLERLEEKKKILKETIPSLDAIRNSKLNKRGLDEKYKKSMAMLKACADTNPQPVLITNSDIEIEYVNSAWQEVFGYSFNEIRGRNPGFLKSGKTPQTVFKQLKTALHSEKLFHSEKIIDKRKDGAFVNMITSIFPIKHGNRKFFVQILNETTKVKSSR